MYQQQGKTWTTLREREREGEKENKRKIYRFVRKIYIYRFFFLISVIRVITQTAFTCRRRKKRKMFPENAIENQRERESLQK